jgi:hypothetical protein
MAEERDIKYINREFTDFRSSLIEFAKNYFPDTYNDFDPTSPGMMFIEMASYVGDVLSFYQDTQLQETFLQHAKNPSNLYALAYMMGYRPKVSTISEVDLTITQRVEAVAPNYTPNWDQALRITEDSEVSATVGDNPSFLTNEVVDFRFSSSYDPTEVTIYSLENNNPAEFLLKKKVRARSGTKRTYTKTYTVAEKFATINIEDSNIIGILSITDSDENTWYEVPYLGQDSIFTDQTNTSSDSNIAPAILSLTKIPRRFVTRFTSNGTLQIQFGAGLQGTDDSSYLPNPTNVGYGTKQDLNKLDYAYDPSNFLFTSAYGLAPSNTTLTIEYLVGGGIAANVPANTINTLVNVDITPPPDPSFTNTLTFNNDAPAQGGKDGDTVEELRQNSLRSFAEQNRTVTSQDFAVRALSLPPKYGSISKVYVTQDIASNSSRSVLDKNPLALSLYTLAYDNEGKLTTASTTLKQNLRTYLSQYMMLTDAIDIKDAFVINIGVKFEIITLPNVPSRDVLLSCTNKLIKYFSIDRWNINQPVNLSSIFTLLDKVKGVQTVKKVIIENKAGGRYSQYGYDTKGATKDNIVYPSYDPSIFEVKFPESDIEGRVIAI